MAKLFSKDDKINLTLTTEQYRSSEVLAIESVSEYLAKTQDAFHTLHNKLFDTESDKALLEVTSKRMETLSILKRLQFADIADEVITKPEKFQGKYTQYLKDLIDVSKTLVPDTHTLLNNAKLGVASFINEYTEDKVLTVYGFSYAKNSSKETENGQKLLSKYFPESKSTFKTRIKDVLRNTGEMEGIYNSLIELDSSVSYSKIKEISKLADEVSEMVDILIEQNNKSGILLRNNEAKKELTEMIHISAERVRFTSYLYANTLYIYNAIQSLSDAIIKVGKSNS